MLCVCPFDRIVSSIDVSLWIIIKIGMLERDRDTIRITQKQRNKEWIELF